MTHTKRDRPSFLWLTPQVPSKVRARLGQLPGAQHTIQVSDIDVQGLKSLSQFQVLHWQEAGIKGQERVALNVGILICGRQGPKH